MKRESVNRYCSGFLQKFHPFENARHARRWLSLYFQNYQSDWTDRSDPTDNFMPEIIFGLRRRYSATVI